MISGMKRKTHWVAGVIWVVVSVPVWGQTSVAPLLQPWQGEHAVEAETSFFDFGSGDAEGGGTTAGFRMRWLTESTRWRFDPTDRNSASIGYAMVSADLITSHPLLPERFIDQSVTGKVYLGQWEDWQVDLNGGIGYAGDAPFNDANAWYGLANLSFTKMIDQSSAWMVVINYDGNRTFLPDVPLPAMIYQNWSDRQMIYALGVPYSTVTWRPDARWMFHAKWALLYNFLIEARYYTSEQMNLYAGYYSNERAITLSGGDPDRRLFYDVARLEAGVQWRMTPWAELVVAGGYAFNQEFSTGWDGRDLTTVVETDDAPFGRVGVTLRF